MPKRNTKKYSRPRKIFDAALIKEENDLIKKYGLKNRKEVWKAGFVISKIRNIAKDLITASDKDKEEFIKRQAAKGFAVSTIAEVLGLSKEDYLKRRLQSIIVQKGFAKTPNQARQFITHKHVKINGDAIDSPSHLTTLEEEMNLEVDLKMPPKETISKEEKEILNKINHEKTEKKENE